MFRAIPFILPLATLVGAPTPTLPEGGYHFEDLGEPVHERSLGMEFVTRGPGEGYTAWATYEAADGTALVGVRIPSGEVVRVDLTRFGPSHIQAAQAPNGDLYLYAGRPGHFLRFDVVREQIEDLGVPARPASYWLGSAVGPDDWFYVGSYPATYLVRCNLRTKEVESLGRIAEDPKECYLLHPAVSDDGIVYCPVGLHHKELWAVDPRTRAKRQILPAELTQSQGIPRVWVGTDGHVYGEADGKQFRCYPDRIEVGQTQPERRRRRPMEAGDVRVGRIDEQGRLVLTHTTTGEVRHIQTSYPGAPCAIYSVSCERDGRIYGGTFSPANTFCYDTATGRLYDLGRISTARIQVYDTLNHPKGLFLTSYMGATVDFFDPAAPIETGRNPRHIVTIPGQERPTQIILGPDGMLYTGTVPSKGRLGGALTRINPNDFSHKVWTNLIPNQSLLYLAPVPETKEIFCTTTISGGSSAIPTEKEAFIFLWDTQREVIRHRDQPVPGTKTYGAVVRARNGLLYGLAENRYYAYDPVARKVVHVGELPVRAVAFPGLSDEPVGPRGLIYGVGEDAVFAIDPADHSARVVVRHASLRGVHGFFVSSDETLYYGRGSHLMRCRLAQR